MHRLCAIILPVLLAVTAGPAGAAPAVTVAETVSKLQDIIANNEDATGRDVNQLIAKLPKAEQNMVVRALRIDPRIVGGKGVTIAEYPWQVALIRGYAAEPMRSQFCGGTLIAPNIVVTAAHCIDSSVVRKDPSRVAVVAGADFYPSGGERIAVEAVFIHPQWDPRTHDYDVAVLKLSAPAKLGRPIPIETGIPPVGTPARVSGWGALSEGGLSTPDLLAAEITVVETSVCNAPASYGGAITARMICAGLEEGGVDSCQGDSGGPLVTGPAGQARLVGVVSWGEGCARRLKYGVYARVSEVAGWIQSLSDVNVPVAALRQGGGAAAGGR